MEPMIDVSLAVSRPTGGALQLNDHTNYELTRPLIRPGMTYRRRAQQGEYQPGEILTGKVRGVATLAFRVRVRGGTWVGHKARMGDLYSALGQFSYTVTEITEGVTTEYRRCQPADVISRDAVDPQFLNSVAYRTQVGWAEYDVSIRCHPQTVEAP